MNTPQFDILLKSLDAACAAQGGWAGGREFAHPAAGDIISTRHPAGDLLLDRSALDAILAQWAGKPDVQGWLLWMDTLTVLDGAAALPDDFLIRGELYSPSGDTSLHLDRRPEGWLAIEFSRREAAESGGLPAAFVETVTQTADRRHLGDTFGTDGGVRLQYEVAWRLDPDGPAATFKPAAFRFLGWDKQTA